MLPSNKTILYDAFGLRCSFLWLLNKTTYSLACKTNIIIAGVLQLIETITHAWLVSTLSQSTLFKSNTFSYHVVVLEQHVKHTVKPFWWSAFRFSDLLLLSILLHFFVSSTCDVIRKTEETIRMQISAYFVSLFYHLNEF